MAPSDVTTRNKAKVWFRLYADPAVYKEPSLHVGDSVRISKGRQTFKKGYLAQWTEEIFTIVKRKSTHPPTFVLTDYSGEVLKGTFYPQKLQKVSKKDGIFRIEKILKPQKHRMLVKWRRYPDKFNSWVSIKDLVWCGGWEWHSFYLSLDWLYGLWLNMFMIRLCRIHTTSPPSTCLIPSTCQLISSG